MSEKFAITISRQYCSGGNEIGKLLADKLSVKFYDKELIALAAKEAGFEESVFENADEKPTNSFFYSLVMGAYPINSMIFQNDDVLNNDKLFSFQSKVIKDVAKKESCVIIGRCSDYILKDEPKLLRVFLWADIDFRKKRLLELYNDVSEKDAINLLNKTDKKRTSYYNYYSGNEWADARNYDLIINTAKIGIENSANQIINYLNDM